MTVFVFIRKYCSPLYPAIEDMVNFPLSQYYLPDTCDNSDYELSR